MSGFAEFDTYLARLRELPELARQVAPDVADAVEAVLEKQIVSAVDPVGQAWAPKKDGTGRPLVGAEKALKVASAGTRIYARLTGHIARHNNGRAKGGVKRQILPTKGIPKPMAEAIGRVVVAQFDEIMGGK